MSPADHRDGEEYTVTADDEIRIIKDAVRLLGDDVASTLWAHGWSVMDLDAAAHEPLVWYWPPTAPIRDDHQPHPSEDTAQRRHQTYTPVENPWVSPTRITLQGTVWRVEYGQAVAQTPARPSVYSSGRELLADLERIEWWPMTPEEARRVRSRRIVEVTMAMARDDHYPAVFPTEPYASQLAALREHERYEHARARRRDVSPPSTPRQQGDLRAQTLLIDATAWASALRTARAGGRGWGISGRE